MSSLEQNGSFSTSLHAAKRYLLLPLLVLTSCALPAESDPPRVVAGIYRWGAEVDVFAPCGEKEVYWVLTSDAVDRQLSGRRQELTPKPYEGIYVVVLGSYAGPVTDDHGFARRYDGFFRVQEVRSARKWHPPECGSDR